MIDVYRDDNHAPSDARPYRARVNGNLLRNARGDALTFRTLAEATRAAWRRIAGKRVDQAAPQRKQRSKHHA
jgi:hypothetical protein